MGGAESQRCVCDDHNLISALSDIIKSQENEKKKLNQSILSSFLLTGITCTYTYLIIIIVSTVMYHHYYNSIFMEEILAEYFLPEVV